MKTEDTEALGK